MMSHRIRVRIDDANGENSNAKIFDGFSLGEKINGVFLHGRSSVCNAEQ